MCMHEHSIMIASDYRSRRFMRDVEIFEVEAGQRIFRAQKKSKAGDFLFIVSRSQGSSSPIAAL